MVAAVSERGLLALGGEGRSMLAVNCHEMIYNIVCVVWGDIDDSSRGRGRGYQRDMRVSRMSMGMGISSWG